MSVIIIKHQQQRLAQLESQLAYTSNLIDEHGNSLEAWELKEYKAVRDDYEQQVSELREALDSATQAH